MPSILSATEGAEARGSTALKERLEWTFYWISVGVAALLALGGAATVLISSPKALRSIILFVLALSCGRSGV